ncbi:hypothetical protein [Candidatus Mancarchaeum acidiphilum]|nr:hypothetical protein [Candidatus Mancarchaeum acidiphilum]
MAIILIAVIAIIFIVHSYFVKVKPNYITENEALSIVTKDIKLENPNSNITIMNITKSKLANDSWDITLRLINYSNSVCPTLEIESYNYPAVTLVPTVISVYSSDCSIYGNQTCETPYSDITMGPVALTCAYIENTSDLNSYITDYGLKNITASAKFYSNLNLTQPKAYYRNIWLLNYSSNLSNYNLIVVMNKSGYIINSFKIPK